MIIYPKTDENFNGLEFLKPYILKYKGLEIQMLSWEKLYKIEDIVIRIKEEFPDLKELTIHPPLPETFNFEVLSYNKFEQEKERIKIIKKLSKKYSIKINLIYHTTWSFISWKGSGCIERLKELLAIIQISEVIILIENVPALDDRTDSTVLNIANYINNDHLKVCLDICHLHCQANIYEYKFNEFVDNFLNKKEKEYIYQIHFAGTLENDGLKDLRTHGRKHINIEDCKADYDILITYGLENTNIVTEVSEDNYSTRVDQIEEIKMLEDIGNTCNLTLHIE